MEIDYIKIPKTCKNKVETTKKCKKMYKNLTKRKNSSRIRYVRRYIKEGVFNGRTKQYSSTKENNFGSIHNYFYIYISVKYSDKSNE